jgi:uncharacterized repeat protein (TIGR01451 family)
MWACTQLHKTALCSYVYIDDDRCLVDNDGFLTVRVTPSERILEVTKKSASKSAVIGEKVLYTTVVINSGNADATNVTLDDKLPVELWPLIALSPKTNPPESILSTQGHCSYTDWSSITDPIKVHCDLGKLAVGEKAIINYAVGVMDAAWIKPGTKISNLVTVKSDQSNLISTKETVTIVKPVGISDEELNDITGSVRKCATIFINLPFLDGVNLLIDRLSKHQITPIEFQSSLIQNTLDLIEQLTRNHDLGLLSKLFSVPDCVKYGRLLFSIGG